MKVKVISILLNIIFVVIICGLLYNINECPFNCNCDKDIPVVPMTITDVKNAEKVQEAVNDTNIYISEEQAECIVEEIEYIVEENVEPDVIIDTNGKEVKEEIKKYAEEKKADVVIVTPTSDKDKPLEEIKETDVINLNQYNIKAYPKNQISITAFNDGTKELDYEHHIKIFKQDAYIGPSVKVDNGDTAVGLKLTIPF